MKLKKEFIAHNTGSETVLVPLSGAGFSGVVQGNKTLGALLELLQNDTTEEQLVADMKERFDAPEGAVERDVKKALAELEKIGALEN